MKKIFVLVVLVLTASVSYILISPLFITVTVNDVVPIPTPSEAPTATSEPTTARVYPITDTAAHPATGTIRLIESPTETIVRFENYQGTNGPDLFVYLAKDLEATEFISLGRARGNEGNINYSVPEGVDLADYPYVLTWCRTFGVLFDYAEIGSAEAL